MPQDPLVHQGLVGHPVLPEREQPVQRDQVVRQVLPDQLDQRDPRVLLVRLARQARLAILDLLAQQGPPDQWAQQGQSDRQDQPERQVPPVRRVLLVSLDRQERRDRQVQPAPELIGVAHGISARLTLRTMVSGITVHHGSPTRRRQATSLASIRNGIYGSRKVRPARPAPRDPLVRRAAQET